MQRFTYTEPRNLLIENDDAVEHNLVLCMGACNTSVPESNGKYINNEFYCDGCRVCVSCGKPAVMDEGYGLTCSPARIEMETGEALDCGEIFEVTYGVAVCNGSLQDAEEQDEAAKDQLDWDNGAYNG